MQQAIFDVAENDVCNILINAVAGSGKSTTIVNLAKRLPRDVKTIFLAFNRDIVRELREKLKDYPNVDVKTLHAFGLNEVRFRYKGTITDREKMIDESKISRIIMSLVHNWGPFLNDENEEDESLKLSYCSRVERIVDIMRFCLPQSRDEVIELCEKFDVMLMNGEIDRAKEVLIASRKINDHFDFADMIYRPAVGDWRLKQYDIVIVDECQDLNRAQQAIIKKIVKPGTGRLIAVGDPKQAIYGFAGADNDSYDNLKNLLPNTKEMPLSVCYRCDQEIIKHAQPLVPQIQWRDGAAEGSVYQGSVSEVQPGDFILCRNTRPLVSLCLQLISKGKKATIKGADIGKNLVTMVKNTRVKGVEPLFNKLQRELDKMVTKCKLKYPLKEVDEIAVIANMKDKIEAIKAISDANKCKSTEEICESITRIFTEDLEGIVLATMHKSKGLEANNVFILEKFRLPAKFAKQSWEIEQEKNLDYVARTRAKHKLVYINDWISDQDKMPDLKMSLECIPEPTKANQ